jgi:hypothetical protein
MFGKRNKQVSEPTQEWLDAFKETWSRNVVNSPQYVQDELPDAEHAAHSAWERSSKARECTGSFAAALYLLSYSLLIGTKHARNKQVNHDTEE